MIKHIIFDFGGVYLNLGGKHSGIPADLAKIFEIPEEQANVIWQANKVKLLTGKETPKQFLTMMNEHLNKALNVEEAHAKWVAINKMEKEHIDWDLVNYTEDLKKRYKIHMLTDTIDLDNGAKEWIGTITNHFDTIHKSYEIGHKKPSPDAFLYVLNKIGAQPEESVFIDDFQANIDAAKAVGMHAIFYKYNTVEQLKKDFSDLGVK